MLRHLGLRGFTKVAIVADAADFDRLLLIARKSQDLQCQVHSKPEFAHEWLCEEFSGFELKG